MSSDKRKAGLLGLLLGDACGVPFEFSSPDTLASLPAGAVDFPAKLPTSFHRAHESAPMGAWSDDGGMALALLHSLDACQGLDLADLSTRFLAWKNQGDYAPQAHIFDIGQQVSRGLKRVEQGADPATSGPRMETDNGNGALMRVLPVALWHDGDDAQLCQIAMQQGLPTHGHLRSQVACALYCLWAKELLDGANDGFDEALDKLEAVLLAQDNDDALRELACIFDDEMRQPTGTGYVVDTLWSVRQAFLSSQDFQAAVVHAIGLGNDTDTVAALTGGLAGIRGGMKALPEAWLAHLAHHPRLDEALEILQSGPMPKWSEPSQARWR